MKNYMDRIINKYSATPNLGNKQLNHNQIAKENSEALTQTISSICSRNTDRPTCCKCIKECDLIEKESDCPGPTCEFYEI